MSEIFITWISMNKNRIDLVMDGLLVFILY